MYGKELREKIIAARQQGIKAAEVSRVFGVSLRMICALERRYRETGSIEPKRIPGRRSKLNEQDLQHIDEMICKRPDITLKELREELNLPISESALCRIVRYKLGYRYKKDHSGVGTRSPRRAGKARTVERVDAED